MTEYFDALETRSPEVRERQLFAALPQQISNAQRNTGTFSVSLAGVDPQSISDRDALARLPVLRKSDLIARQQEQPPFGGLVATPVAELGRLFASPGPIFEPEARRTDYWRLARALYAAGFRRGDLVHNTFSYHFTPAGSMLESGLHALGCPVFPAGVGQTELQVQTIATLAPVGYVGTPSFLKLILEKAAEMGEQLSSMSKALVSGEALPPSLRAAINDHGIRTLQCYATADLGLIAYESPAEQGMIVDEQLIVEIVRPGGGDPVAAGEVGEVVVTTFNPDYPLVRFATGDLSAVLPGPSPCGRTNTRIKGWLGRADQTTKVKGMFVHTQQVDAIVKRHPEIQRARLVVTNTDGVDAMSLRCEVASADESLASAVIESLREICKLRGKVEMVAPASLPNDGKVIDDVRSYE